MAILRSHTSNSSVYALAEGLPHVGSDWASDGYADVHVDEDGGGDNDAGGSDDDEAVVERPPYNTRLQERLRLARKPPHVSLTAQTSMLDRVAGGRGYAGPLFGADAPSRRLVEVPIGDGGPVSIFDINGFKTVHRAAFNSDPTINNAAMRMAELVNGRKPTFNSTQMRGNFDTHYFSLHRGSTLTPTMSPGCVGDNEALFQQLKTVAEPIRLHFHDVFKQEFPKLCTMYETTMDIITEAHRDEGLSAAFYPWGSFCINSSRRGVVSKPHIDMQNMSAGLCGVMPFGDFDPTQDCKLHIKELGYTFQVAAGSPIFFPSALYTHYNSKLMTGRFRGSVVAWTGASLFQYVNLGCRAVMELSVEERKEYKAGLKASVLAGFNEFPRRSL